MQQFSARGLPSHWHQTKAPQCHQLWQAIYTEVLPTIQTQGEQAKIYESMEDQGSTHSNIQQDFLGAIDIENMMISEDPEDDIYISEQNEDQDMELFLDDDMNSNHSNEDYETYDAFKYGFFFPVRAHKALIIDNISDNLFSEGNYFDQNVFADSSQESQSSSEEQEKSEENTDDIPEDFVSGRILIESHLRQDITVVHFPSESAGAPISHQSAYDSRYGYMHYGNIVNQDENNIYAPFQSRIDWEFACWAKMRGPGSTAVSELLSIEGVCYFSVSITSTNLYNSSYRNLLAFHIKIQES